MTKFWPLNKILTDWNFQILLFFYCYYWWLTKLSTDLELSRLFLTPTIFSSIRYLSKGKPCHVGSFVHHWSCSAVEVSHLQLPSVILSSRFLFVCQVVVWFRPVRLAMNAYTSSSQQKPHLKKCSIYYTQDAQPEEVINIKTSENQSLISAEKMGKI